MLEGFRGRFPDHELTYFQSNVEGELINFLQSCRQDVQGVILNAGGYTHTSIALHDAIKGTGITLIELHISNIHRREPPHNHSLMSRAATAVIAGLGPDGYPTAVGAMLRLLEMRAQA